MNSNKLTRNHIVISYTCQFVRKKIQKKGFVKKLQYSRKQGILGCLSARNQTLT